MRKKLPLIGVMLLLGFVATGSDCIFDTKVVDLIVTGETYTPKFNEDHGTEEWITSVTYDVSDELDAILGDNDVEKADVDTARLISVTYEVVTPDDHDWEISGSITIGYAARGRSEIIVDYDTVSLDAITGAPMFADLNPAGVAVFHEAVDDYLAGASPVLTFAAVNGDVVPDPTDSEQDPPGRINFSWKACLRMYVVLDEEFDWPDVWPESD